MIGSSNDSPDSSPHKTGSTAATDSPFSFPVDPGYEGRPPRGEWMDGYLLSLTALDTVKDRPEVFDERDLRMCGVEFKL